MTGGRTAPRLAMVVVVGLVCGIVLASLARSQGSNDPVALNAEVVRLYQAGKYAEAVDIAKRSLGVTEKMLGPNHPDVGLSLNNLAALYREQGRYVEAEPLYRRSLAIYEKALGPDNPSVGTSLNNLALLYQAQGRYAEAEPLHKRSLAVREKALGPEHPDVGQSLNNLAGLYGDQGRLAEAEPLYKRSLSIREMALGPEHPDVGVTLNNLAGLNKDRGRYSEAEPLYKRSLAIREKALGPEHPDVGLTLNNLALLYQGQGRYAEAEPLYRRSFTIAEKVLGPDHPNVGRSLNNLALLYQTQGRYAEAEPLHRRSLAIREKALDPDHPDVGTALNNLATLYQAQGRYTEAAPLYERSLAVLEKGLGPEHFEVGTSLNNLAELYWRLGRYAEAEPLYKRGLSIREKILGFEHPDVGHTLENLAALYEIQGHYAEAEPLYKRGLAIREKALGPDHRDVGLTLNNLAALYEDQGRYIEAEPLYKRSLAVFERALGPEHSEVGTALNNLAGLYQYQGRFAEAEPIYKRGLAIREKAWGSEHPDVAGSLNNLAELYRELGRTAEAEPLYRRSLVIYEKAFGPEHPLVGTALNNLAVLKKAQDRYAEAEPLHRRSLAIREKTLGPEHRDVGSSLNNLATLAYAQSDWSGAADYWRRSTVVIKRRAQRGVAGDRSEASDGEAQRLASQFWGLIKASHRLPAQRHSPLAAEMFETAQWAQGSEAATSVAQMAARSATGLPELAALVRERQDLVREWQVKDKHLIAAKSAEPAKRKPEHERGLAERLAAIDASLADINRRLAKDFPDYAALASLTPLSIADLQAHLGADEALLLFLDTPEWKPLPEETFIWVVTKSDMRWVRSGFGTMALSHEVAALRCGLDGTAWYGNGVEKCAGALGITLDQAPHPGKPLPFDHARAHKLYAALFGEAQDLINNKHLLIVPTGALTQLPFQVLLTRPPTSNEHHAAAWLAREHAVTVLPAVSSLRALRRVSKPSAAPRPMIGFGNPLLDGHAGLSKLAREKQSCRETIGQQKLALTHPRTGVAQVKTRGGLADVAQIRQQIPLPETADELCAVAHDMKAAPGDIRLGAQATEREIKRLSASGELARYRMLHFATHGVLAGQLDGTHEPGLILTPPDKATEEDDGYLSASEIAALKLDADWVILSACNTAAGAATSAEALSGLARAFIYAQARALLVSHWEVYSDATVKLITIAIREMARDPKVGRSEALRRSMLALIDNGEPHEAHPSYWAPFVVVGEGAARR